MTRSQVAASVHRLAAPLLLCLLVTASSVLLLRNLGDPYITLWDEAVHVNVIRTLETSCCTPQLHRQLSGADPRDWTDSHVWLHKPPMPFYAHAAVARLVGHGVWGIRLAAVLLAEALVVLVFVIGVKFFGTWIGLLAATLVAFNHYTFQLVQGRQFSGVPDLALACVLMLALSRILSIENSPEWRQYVAFGALAGLAFLCKDGLALIPFVVLALAPTAWPWRRHVAGCMLAVSCAAVVLLPPTLYIARLFPLEALFEHQHRVAHLLRDIEGWGRPFDYYFTVYLARATSPLMLGSIFAATAVGLFGARRHPRLTILSLWIAAYLVVLSLGVSKISNFIYPVVPVASLLVSAAAVVLWRERRYDLVVAACVPVLITAVLLQWNLFNSSQWFVDFPGASRRATLVLFKLGTVLLALQLLKRVRVPNPAVTSFTAAGVAIGLILRRPSMRASPPRRDGHVITTNKPLCGRRPSPSPKCFNRTTWCWWTGRPCARAISTSCIGLDWKASRSPARSRWIHGWAKCRRRGACSCCGSPACRKIERRCSVWSRQRCAGCVELTQNW